MPTDWTKPGTGSTKTSFPTEIIALATDAAKMIHTGSLNLPVGTIAYNRTTDQLEEYDGAVWNTAPVGVPVGATLMWLQATAPSGFLMMQGGTIGNAASAGTARANADCSALFTYLWTNLTNTEAPVSSGRGASAAADFAANKTITIPDMRQKFPIGQAASGTGATLGGTGGVINHSHTVPAHYHDMSGAGSTLSTTNSGASNTGTESADHNHTFSGNTGTQSANHTHNNSFSVSNADKSWSITGGGSAGYVVAGNAPTDGDSVSHTHSYSGTTNGKNATHTHSTPNHTHPMTGLIGLGSGSGGVSGNAAMSTGNVSGVAANSNPPFLAFNFIIKF